MHAPIWRWFAEEIVARERIARRYSAALADVAVVPRVARGAALNWAQYIIRLAPAQHEPLAAAPSPHCAPPGALPGLPRGPRWRARGRTACRGGDQPSHACPGSDHRGGTGRAGRVSGGNIDSWGSRFLISPPSLGQRHRRAVPRLLGQHCDDISEIERGPSGEKLGPIERERDRVCRSPSSRIIE
jgi:hypothetical protein